MTNPSDLSKQSETTDRTLKTQHAVRNIAIGIAAVVLAIAIVIIVLMLLGPTDGVVYMNTMSDI